MWWEGCEQANNMSSILCFDGITQETAWSVYLLYFFNICIFLTICILYSVVINAALRLSKMDSDNWILDLVTWRPPVILTKEVSEEYWGANSLIEVKRKLKQMIVEIASTDKFLTLLKMEQKWNWSWRRLRGQERRYSILCVCWWGKSSRKDFLKKWWSRKGEGIWKK